MRVLGSISVEVDGRPVPIGGPLPRRLLAVLLANRGAVLSVDRLVEVLWGDEPPEAATSSLHTYVARLRRLLPPSVHLETAAPGYRLRLDPGAADVERFEAALGEALACSRNTPRRRSPGWRRRWVSGRATAFAEFAEEWWAQGEAARLKELHLHAREAHAETLLGLGRSEAAVSEARAVTADHPSREQAWQTLVVGLHRCGRQRDALRAAGEYRARLRDESGLDPSKDFAALEHAIAVDEPSELTRPRNVTPPVVGVVPRGTVTFLFTDVEGSTRLWEEDGEAMRSALAAHDRILRSVIEAHDGYVFSTAGDAFCAAFSTPGQAVGAAVEAQRRLGAESWPVALRVRMGLHTGTAEEREGDYFGPAVNRAARVMSAGHGGQVLLSLVTEELVRDRLPDDVSLAGVG